MLVAMDPLSVLSIAANVAGLANLTELTVKTLYKFIRGIRECRGEVKDLLLMVSELGCILRSLEVCVERFSDKNDSGEFLSALLLPDLFLSCCKVFGIQKQSYLALKLWNNCVEN
jgi:hypothetical protein